MIYNCQLVLFLFKFFHFFGFKGPRVIENSYGLPWNCLDMGNLPSSIDAALHADVAPDYKNPSKFDPLTGFQNGRKERGFHLSIQAYSLVICRIGLFFVCILSFSIQSCRSRNAPLYLCQHSFYKIFVKFRNSRKKCT
jgi:hypothetical protein